MLESMKLLEAMNSAERCEFDKLKPTNHNGGYHTRWSCMLGLSAAARFDLWRRIDLQVLLQQQLYSRSEAFYFKYYCTCKALLSPVELNRGC